MTGNVHDRQMIDAFPSPIGDGRMAKIMSSECQHSDKQS